MHRKPTFTNRIAASIAASLVTAFAIVMITFFGVAKESGCMWK